MNQERINRGRSNGQILALVLLVVVVVMMTTLVIIGGSRVFSDNTYYSLREAQAFNLAEAGIDKAVVSLNATGGTYQGEAQTPLGPGEFSITITTPDANTKLIESTGFIPSKDNPKVKRTIKINVAKGEGISFNYGVQTGEGGFEMSNVSKIIGSLYSNGNVVMSNNAQITGDAYVAGGTAPTADQENSCSDPYCDDFIFGKNIGSDNRLDVAQSFRPTTGNYINKVAVRLKKQGLPSDITVRLLADSGGKPDEKTVLASGTLTANLVTDQYGFVEIPFISPPSLVADTDYWVLLDTSNNSTNFWYWSADTMQSYNRGQAKWSPDWQAKNPVWNSLSPPADLDFKIYLGGVATYIQGSSGVIIGGDAHANTLQDLTVTGSAYYQAVQNVTAGNLVPGSADPPSITMPVSEGNITAWKTRAENVGPPSPGINGCVSEIGPGKYTGDINIANNCVVAVKDPVWITGALNLSNGVILSLDPSSGASSGVMIVDGQITLANTVEVNGSGTSGSYLMLLTTFDSRTNGQTALSVANAGTNGLLYAPFGIADIANGDQVSELTAWKVRLGNGVQIKYETGFASTFFSSGPSGAYSLVKGTYQLK